MSSPSAIDLSTFKPSAGGPVSAAPISNALTAIEAWTAVASPSPATVATTVGGLGTATDGKIGRVRCGTTPWDFVDVVYDATYAKWVSPVRIACELGNGSITSSASYSNIGTSSSMTGSILPWRVFSTAGLTWQFRWTGWIVTAVSQSAMGIRLQAQTADYESGGLAGDSTNIFGEVTSFVANTSRTRTSGWVAINPSITLRDVLSISPQYKSDGTRNLQVVGGSFTVEARLVG